MTTIPVAADGTISSADYREIFGRLPTGVTAITGTTHDDKPLGFIVGTFQSLSMDPPLVAFSVDKSSSTWPWIRTLEEFTANILSTDQLPICKALSRKGPDKFDGLVYEKSPLGTPKFPDSTAWIHCRVLHEIVAGDHYVVVGAITEMEIGTGDALIFRGGKFGEFTQWEQPAQSQNQSQRRPHHEHDASQYRRSLDPCLGRRRHNRIRRNRGRSLHPPL